MVTLLAQRDAAAAALGDECSNNRGAVQKTEAPQKPRKADDERSNIHHYIYIYMCVCLCVFVCVSVAWVQCHQGCRVVPKDKGPLRLY